MSTKSTDENAKTLAQFLGVDEEDATLLLDKAILITAAADESSQRLSRYLVALLERTFAKVHDHVSPSVDYSAEVVVGRAAPEPVNVDETVFY